MSKRSSSEEKQSKNPIIDSNEDNLARQKLNVKDMATTKGDPEKDVLNDDTILFEASERNEANDLMISYAKTGVNISHTDLIRKAYAVIKDTVQHLPNISLETNETCKNSSLTTGKNFK